MASVFSVSLEKIKNEFSLEEIHSPYDCSEKLIISNDVNRPGLNLVGDYDFYDEKRIQIIGNAEYGYLKKLCSEKRREVLEQFMEHKPPLIVVTRANEVLPEMLDSAKKYNVFLMRTAVSTSRFIAEIISFLHVELAPRITCHGVLVEVYGEGILLLGESGVGKSEAAIELVKRGHRLIADDAVEIRKVSEKTLVGSSPENIRHFVELRGIGIINVRQIFGIGAVKVTEKVDMVINLEQWDNKKVYDRIGLENEKTDILGVFVNSLTLPVRPGRNLAVIIEVAAMSNRQKKMGYNAAEALMKQLGMVVDDDSVGDIAPRA
ncbi:MAG: HPr(Ser) kinase/phosphatase [Oscillospiraceae bacterium]|nr:HPr(Ser) kinase/phosphatase [Oscillospiraceae bacterium]